MKKILLSLCILVGLSFAAKPNLEMFIELDKKECIGETVNYKYISICKTYEKEFNGFTYTIKKVSSLSKPEIMTKEIKCNKETSSGARCYSFFNKKSIVLSEDMFAEKDVNYIYISNPYLSDVSYVYQISQK